jgi:hypothetical protein
MMSARAVIAASLGAMVSLSAKTATACRLLPTELHHIQPALAASDTRAPGVPVLVEVDAYRRNGMTCTQQSCVANTCGDTGTVRIELAPGVGDPEGSVGYRLVVVEGDVPESIAPMLGVNLAGQHALFLRPSFQEIVGLDLSLSAVAVDAAGNESAPSEPFRVQFDGCTLAAVGDECEDEVDPTSDLSVLVDGTGVAEEASATPVESMGCSLRGVTPSSALPFSAALGLAVLSLVRRLRRVG